MCERAPEAAAIGHVLRSVWGVAMSLQRGSGVEEGIDFHSDCGYKFPFLKKFNDCTFIINYFLVLSLHLIFNTKIDVHMSV